MKVGILGSGDVGRKLADGFIELGHTGEIGSRNPHQEKIIEWSFNGTGPDGKAVTITGKVTDVLHRQSDGNWHILIDNP